MTPAELDGAPRHFKHADARWKELPGMEYTLAGCRGGLHGLHVVR